MSSSSGKKSSRDDVKRYVSDEEGSCGEERPLMEEEQEQEYSDWSLDEEEERVPKWEADDKEDRKPAATDNVEDQTKKVVKEMTTVEGEKRAPASPQGEELLGAVLKGIETMSAKVPLLVSKSVAEHLEPLKVNVMQKNSRDFFTTEVVLMLNASLADLASGREDAVLKLDPDVTCFEMPGRPENLGRTQMHAQGRIHLLGVRSTFPVTIGIKVGEELRGAMSQMVHSGKGFKGAHIALPDDKINYSMRPQLLADADIGEHTNEYASTYPEYLSEKAMKSSILKVHNNPSLAQVKIGSPVFDAINTAREALREKEMKKSEADRIDESLTKPLDVNSDHAHATGFAYANAAEVLEARRKIKQVFRQHVNYGNLYSAFQFPLERAFKKKSESGVQDAKAQWIDPTELQNKKRAGPMSSEQLAAALNEQHTLYARFMVEFMPLEGLKCEEDK